MRADSTHIGAPAIAAHKQSQLHSGSHTASQHVAGGRHGYRREHGRRDAAEASVAGVKVVREGVLEAKPGCAGPGIRMPRVATVTDPFATRGSCLAVQAMIHIVHGLWRAGIVSAGVGSPLLQAQLLGCQPVGVHSSAASATSMRARDDRPTALHTDKHSRYAYCRVDVGNSSWQRLCCMAADKLWAN